MSTYRDYTKEYDATDFGNDTIAIPLVLETKRGGCTLNMEAWNAAGGDAVIPAGIPIYFDSATNSYLPAIVKDKSVTASTTGVLEGILAATILASKPDASILYRGVVNPKAVDVVNYASILAGLKTAFPLINFKED